MKRAICFLCVLTVSVSFLCACSKDKNKDNRPTMPEKTSVNLDSEYELGMESETTIVESGGGQQVVHIDEYGDDIRIEHCDENGEVIYFEEPVYDASGEVKGYKYYDKKKNLIACLDTYNSFYDKDGNFITESDFEKMISELR